MKIRKALKIRILAWMGIGMFFCGSAALADPFYAPKPEPFGSAFHAAKSNQILNPMAGQDSGPVSGLNGVAADLLMDNYYKSFERSAPASPSVINIGGFVAGGGCKK